MESNKLAVLENKLPLRAYPESQLDKVLGTVFKFWLANLLSIKADNEEKLDNAMPAIKKHFWSLGMDEVKKAFEKYADGELSIKPVSNYFDRILVGQIFNEYRQSRPIKTKPVVTNKQLSEVDKDEILKSGVIRCENEYKEYGMVLPGNQHIYDYLDEQGIIDVPNERKKELMVEASLNLKKSSSILEKYVKSEGRVMSEAKILALEEYFEHKNSKK